MTAAPPAVSAAAIVVPAYEPPRTLPAYLASLREKTPVPILLVDDGSRAEAAAVFRACTASVADVELLVHPANRGKGRALKTAFAHLLETRPGLAGCVTCDCDGQHAPEDVARCLAALAADPGAVVLGCRAFSLAHVPWKSRLGNNAMRALFRLVTGRAFRDTQTGLRAIPADFMRELLDCPGERFEFETRMLLRLGRRKLVQLPIRTLYADGNRATHFDPFADSLRVVSIVLAEGAAKFARFVISSVLSFALDIGLFSLLYYRAFPADAQARLLLSVAAARTVSLLFNYSANRRFVFADARADRAFDGRAFASYLLLAAAILGASWAFTALGHRLLPAVPVAALKAVVDFLLFLSSYAVQRTVVFRPAAAENRK